MAKSAWAFGRGLLHQRCRKPGRARSWHFWAHDLPTLDGACLPALQGTLRPPPGLVKLSLGVMVLGVNPPSTPPDLPAQPWGVGRRRLHKHRRKGPRWKSVSPRSEERIKGTTWGGGGRRLGCGCDSQRGGVGEVSAVQGVVSLGQATTATVCPLPASISFAPLLGTEVTHPFRPTPKSQHWGEPECFIGFIATSQCHVVFHLSVHWMQEKESGERMNAHCTPQ